MLDSPGLCTLGKCTAIVVLFEYLQCFLTSTCREEDNLRRSGAGDIEVLYDNGVIMEYMSQQVMYLDRSFTARVDLSPKIFNCFSASLFSAN